MLKAVIFDMDGTLGDTLGLCIEAYRQVTLEYTGKKPSAQEVTHFFGISDRGVLGGLLGMPYDAPDLPVGRFVQIYEELHPALSPQPFDGAVATLRQLKGWGLKLGLVTGKEGYTATPTLRRFGMEGLFDWEGLGKPTHNCKAERLQEAMDFFSLRADEMIYVGDAPSDISQCHSVGVPIVNAAWAPEAEGGKEACLALNPDYRLTDFSALAGLIHQLLTRE